MALLIKPLVAPLVPFLDLAALHAPIENEIQSAMNQVIRSSSFVGGEFVERFEQEFATFCGLPHAIGVSSGTSALQLALEALGIGLGDEVITAPNSFFATAAAIVRAGARPVFSDVDPLTYTLDPDGVEAAITSRTRAVIPVHLYGQPADMAAICRIAARRNLAVIEDACQAHGAEYRGWKIGSLGNAACFSFYPGKNLGAMGDAGAIVTGDPQLAQRLKALREHGQIARNCHEEIGLNARLDALQAAVLSVKLPHLERSNRRRLLMAEVYTRELAPFDGVVTPFHPTDNRHVFHIYAIRVADRDTVFMRLRDRGIECGIHYPTPIHLQRAFEYLGLGRGSFPVAEQLAEEVISLPISPTLSFGQLDRVIAELRDVTNHLAGQRAA